MSTMDCTNIPVANSLNYCAGQTYGQGIVHVGESFPYLTSVPLVVLTNAASGRKQVVTAGSADDLPLLSFEQPDDLSPGQVYILEVVDGMEPIAFNPYVYDQATGTWAVGDTNVMAVAVRFVKLFDVDGVHSHEVQYITLQ